MNQADAPLKRQPGRPLSFDREQALMRALHQFWKSGYETTSVADLTTAMGITAPSLYTAFGDKESLFLECVERYTRPAPKSATESIDEAPSARQAAQDLLEFAADWFTQPDAPAGCLVASAAATGSEASVRVRAALKQVRESTRKALQKRIERDMQEGNLPPHTNARALAATTLATMQGMSVLARDGASRTLLREIATTAMAAWPARLRPGRPRRRKAT